MEHTFWIWYPGDFELYHAMKFWMAGILEE